jgi:hypothetical protein
MPVLRAARFAAESAHPPPQRRTSCPYAKPDADRFRSFERVVAKLRATVTEPVAVTVTELITVTAIESVTVIEPARVTESARSQIPRRWPLQRPQCEVKLRGSARASPASRTGLLVVSEPHATQRVRLPRRHPVGVLRRLACASLDLSSPRRFCVGFGLAVEAGKRMRCQLGVLGWRNLDRIV